MRCAVGSIFSQASSAGSRRGQGQEERDRGRFQRLDLGHFETAGFLDIRHAEHRAAVRSAFHQPVEDVHVAVAQARFFGGDHDVGAVQLLLGARGDVQRDDLVEFDGSRLPSSAPEAAVGACGASDFRGSRMTAVTSRAGQQLEFGWMAVERARRPPHSPNTRFGARRRLASRTSLRP
jgi:hypothetical protein